MKSAASFSFRFMLPACLLMAACAQTQTPPASQNGAASANAASQPATPSAETKSPAFGSLEVTSKPPGARVLLISIDESGASEPQLRGVTPTTITKLSPGKYAVDLEMTGYRYYQKTVEISENATAKVNAALRRQ